MLDAVVGGKALGQILEMIERHEVQQLCENCFATIHAAAPPAV